MGQIGFSGRRGATGDVGASAERRNAPEMPIWPTEGRAPAAPGVVARLARCTHIAPHHAPNHGTRERGQTGSVLSKLALDSGGDARPTPNESTNREPLYAKVRVRQ